MNQSNLKQDLLNIESSIKAITGDSLEYMTYWWRNDKKRDKVKTLLHQRCTILNKMFAATPAEIDRFKQVNEMLYDLTSQLFNRVKKLSSSHKIIADTTFDDDYEIDGTLRVVIESETDILTLDNDDFYGSNFLLMNHILYLLYDNKNSNIEWFNADAIAAEEKPLNITIFVVI